MEEHLRDIAFFKKFYKAHFHAVVRLCRSYLKSEDIALDVAQDSFYKLYSRMSASYSPENALAFVYITARNHCLDILRKKKFKCEEIETLSPDLFAEDFFLEEISRQEMFRLLYEAIEQLKGRSYQIARLALEGKSNQEIADTLQISVNSLKTLKKGLYLKLRKALGNEYMLLLFLKYHTYTWLK